MRASTAKRFKTSGAKTLLVLGFAAALTGCVGGETQNEAAKALGRSAEEAVKVFESACLDNRRSASKSIARLKEIGFTAPEGATDGRLSRGGVLAAATRDAKGVNRCFTSSPVADLAAFATEIHLMVTRKFPGSAERGSAGNSPAWKLSPKGEPAFVVSMRAVQQGPDKPVLAIVTLSAPRR